MKREEYQKEALELLKELLSIPSVNGSDDERVIAKHIYDLLKKYQITAELQEIDDHHANVIAFLEGKQKERTVIWNGHLDTVSYGNLSEWDTTPYVPVQVHNKLYARGASDMKSGLAAMLYALITMKKREIQPIANICFIGTCDEEKGGLGATAILERNIIKDAEALIIGEPTDCQLGIAQKGCIWLELLTFGKTGHGAYPEEGTNAIHFGFKAAGRLRQYLEQFSHPLLGKTTAQITMVNGGIAPNMTPDQCTLLMDIRITPNVNLQMVLSELEYICMKLKDEATHKLEFEYQIKNYRLPVETVPDNEWVDKFRRAQQAVKRPVRDIGINYFTDASILVKEKSDLPVLLFGPGEPNMAHKPNEWVSVDQYDQSIQTLLSIFGGIKL